MAEKKIFGLRCCIFQGCLFLSTVDKDNLDLDTYGSGIYI